MTVIAEEMEVIGIFNRSWSEGLKESFVKRAPGYRPMEENSGSVGVQKDGPRVFVQAVGGLGI